MAKSTKTTPAPAPVSGPTDPPLVTLEYIGPVGHTSPVFGLLGVGQRYQANVTFADYLLEHHPDYWTRPRAAATS